MLNLKPGDMVLDTQISQDSNLRHFLVQHCDERILMGLYYDRRTKSTAVLQYHLYAVQDAQSRFTVLYHTSQFDCITDDLSVLQGDKRYRAQIACEESQTMCKALRELGWEAYSCDTQYCSGGKPEWHIMGDCLPYLDGDCTFETCDHTVHHIDGEWDLLICHPPCTYLSNASSVRLKVKGVIDEERMKKARVAKVFFLRMLNAKCKHICVENPIPGSIHELPKYTYLDEPFNHGDPWRKRTAFWLKGLYPVDPTNIVEPKGLWVGSTSGRRASEIYSQYELTSIRDSKKRSKTFPGMANAMAKAFTKQITGKDTLLKE